MTLYALTLFLSLLVVGGSITLVHLQRSTRHLQASIASGEQAMLLAEAGIGHARRYADTNPDWRSDLTSGTRYTTTIDGLGKFTFAMTTNSGDLATSEFEDVTIWSEGEAGGAIRALTGRAGPNPNPILEYALASMDYVVFSSGTPEFRGPVYAENAIADFSGVNIRDETRFEVTAGGWISSSLSPRDTDAALLDYPTMDTSYYIKMGTALGTRNLVDVNLTATDNTLGTANGTGVYYIDIGGSDFRMERCHVAGTLVIIGSGGDVDIVGPCSFEPGPANFPVLITDIGSGQVRVDMNSTTKLDESASKVDFNEDGDVTDNFAARMTGLVWTEANVTFLRGGQWSFNGCWIASAFILEGNMLIDNDPNLIGTLTPGFGDGKLHMRGNSIVEYLP